MAIRDKFRRAVGSRKSTASSSSSSSTHASETASNPDSDAASSNGSPIDRNSRSRTFTWRSKNGDAKEQSAQPQKSKPTKSKSRWTMPDPREKPFTEMNLRYQQILGSYELTFGTSHPEQLWNPDGELSPGTSRQNSIDLGRN